MIRNQLLFIGEFFREFRTTGTICETSKWAASELTLPLRHRDQPRRILEVGAGTGSVTRRALEQMTDRDTLVICEINPRLARRLQVNLEQKSAYRRHRDRVKIFVGPIQELQSETKFDLIICSLPFLNFDRELVEEIFRKLESLSTDKTLMTYYEFIGLRELGKCVSPSARRRRIRDVEDFFADLKPRQQISQKTVLLNMPPIHVYTLRLVA